LKAACFDLGKCNDGEGLDWLRIAHRHYCPFWQRLCKTLRTKEPMDEYISVYTVVRISSIMLYKVKTCVAISTKKMHLLASSLNIRDVGTASSGLR